MVIRSNKFSGYAKQDEKIEECHRRALVVFDNIIGDNKINAPDVNP